MKFKKIEISAFRIYDKPENATFDFSVNNDTTADFISIYAPNGYGKTSFYDAVEWGMTNNIQRFWQNKVRTKDAIDALKSLSDTQVKLWRNIHSNQETYVKILGDGINPIVRYLKPHGKKKSDANIDDNDDNLENRTFRNVILSQEWISAFLREIDGTKRYEIFMDNPDLKEVNSYYKNLKALLFTCERNISGINQKISDEQKRISALEKENILEKINLQIDILTEKFQQSGLNKITLATTKEEVSRLKNLVAERVVSINDDTAIQEKLDWVLAAKIGNNEYISIRVYFELEARIKTIDDTQRAISDILNRFADSEIKSNEIVALDNLLSEKEIIKNFVLGIIGQFEEYSRISSLLRDSENRSRLLRTEINAKSEDLNKLEKQETETRVELNSALAGIEQTNTTIAGLPERLLVIKKIEQEINVQGEKLAQEKEQLRPLETKFKTIESEIVALEEEVADIKSGNYTKTLIEDQVLAASIDVMLANLGLLSKNEEQLLIISDKIGKQEVLNAEITAFIRQGLEIVNKDRNRTNCPLCEQTYKSHQELAERIANNNVLDKILQEFLADKNKLEQETARLEELVKSAIAQLLLYFEKKIKNKQILRAEVSDHQKTLTKTIASYEESLEMRRNDLRELMMQQLGLSNEDYEQDLNRYLEAYRKSEERLNVLMKNLTQDKKQLNDLIAKLRDELKLVSDNIDALLKSEQYLSVLEWFKTNFSNEIISLEVLQNELAANDETIKEYFDKISTLKAERESLTLELSAFNQQVEKNKLSDLSIEKELAKTKMDGFRSLLKDRLEIESEFIDFKTLVATLEMKENDFIVSQINNKSLVDEYVKTEKFADHINEFLQSENAKIELQKLAEDQEFLELNVQTLLTDEILKTKSFLQEKVKEFFYEALINDLYRKIDPHPDFKEVHFSADFDAETPRLNVFVRNKLDQNIDLIPNLYFSTAQINILSLSIFLASALNTPGYDCVFIDDPIQSMDSVNILSTIDLIRSLVINYNKQIILSTHDETIFNLLKKKMPSGLFKSKFIELESVGKVKATV